MLGKLYLRKIFIFSEIPKSSYSGKQIFILIAKELTSSISNEEILQLSWLENHLSFVKFLTLHLITITYYVYHL